MLTHNSPDGTESNNPSWSPDGVHIAFVELPAGSIDADIWQMDYTGANRSRSQETANPSPAISLRAVKGRSACVLSTLRVPRGK
jgi:hypothetical protein